MKHAIILAAAALALAGCSKSADRKFEEMYAYQLKHDPSVAAMLRPLYERRSEMTDEQKMKIVNKYNELRAENLAVGQDGTR